MELLEAREAFKQEQILLGDVEICDDEMYNVVEKSESGGAKNITCWGYAQSNMIYNLEDICGSGSGGAGGGLFKKSSITERYIQ